MKINFEMQFKNLDGTVIKGDNQKELELKVVAINALLMPSEDDARLSGEEKIKRWLLAQRIYGNSELDLTSEEISLLKSLIARTYSSIIVGQAWMMLEGK